ncbi:MAG TPA: class I SAM-dependent methyltransferase [Myxococcota bacterium]|nr:class I SAM-dependent methyltransferase [Myxococcota bacterium]
MRPDLEILFRLIKRGLITQSLLARQVHRIEDMLAGLAEATLDSNARTRLTAEVYGARGEYKLDEMFSWEEEWFAEDLPAAPARILLGGAGSGREVRYLAEKDYQIVAFDPAESFVAHARKHIDCPECRAFLCGSYEDLAFGKGERVRKLQNEIERHAPYQAVVLGWGSFTHVSSVEARRALLDRLRELCPHGPVLLSFWMRTESSEMRKSRAWRLGWKLGNALTRKRPDDAVVDPGDFFVGNAGFGHFFTLKEFEQLASRAGYRLARAPGGKYAGTFPHATLVPASDTGCGQG